MSLPEQPEPDGLSRTELVVQGVSRLILDGRLSPGERLPVEHELAAMLGVSRGSLREGIRALAVLGIVETRQGAGSYVTSLAPDLVVEPLGLILELQSLGHALPMHQVRRMLETQAAGLAAARAAAEPALLDPAHEALERAGSALAGTDSAATERLIEADVDFHRAIATMAGNPVLGALIEALAGRTVRHRIYRARADVSADARSHREHEAILAAVRAGDGERARTHMASHLFGVEEFLTQTESQP